MPKLKLLALSGKNRVLLGSTVKFVCLITKLHSKMMVLLRDSSTTFSKKKPLWPSCTSSFPKIIILHPVTSKWSFLRQPNHHLDIKLTPISSSIPKNKSICFLPPKLIKFPPKGYPFSWTTRRASDQSTSRAALFSSAQTKTSTPGETTPPKG